MSAKISKVFKRSQVCLFPTCVGDRTILYSPTYSAHLITAFDVSLGNTAEDYYEAGGGPSCGSHVSKLPFNSALLVLQWGQTSQFEMCFAIGSGTDSAGCSTRLESRLNQIAPPPFVYRRHQRAFQKKKKECEKLVGENEVLRDSERSLRIRCRTLVASDSTSRKRHTNNSSSRDREQGGRVPRSPADKNRRSASTERRKMAGSGSAERSRNQDKSKQPGSGSAERRTRTSSADRLARGERADVRMPRSIKRARQSQLIPSLPLFKIRCSPISGFEMCFAPAPLVGGPNQNTSRPRNKEV